MDRSEQLEMGMDIVQSAAIYLRNGRVFVCPEAGPGGLLYVIEPIFETSVDESELALALEQGLTASRLTPGQEAPNLRDYKPPILKKVERVATAAIGARPAFLLDAHRASFGHALGPGTFDNRSVCFESDFPSAKLLLQAGIRRVLLIQQDENRPDIDIESVLFAWQHGGLQLWRKATRTPMVAAPFVLQRRSWLARAAHHIRRRYDNLVQRAHLEVDAGPGGG
jgi:hypothetical protein